MAFSIKTPPWLIGQRTFTAPNKAQGEMSKFSATERSVKWLEFESILAHAVLIPDNFVGYLTNWLGL
jgi:hypothetical protein